MKSLSVLVTILLLAFAKLLAVQLKRAGALPADRLRATAGFSGRPGVSNTPAVHVSKSIKKVHYYE
jgi:hypothetical protein